MQMEVSQDLVCTSLETNGRELRQTEHFSHMRLEPMDAIKFLSRPQQNTFKLTGINSGGGLGLSLPFKTKRQA